MNANVPPSIVSVPALKLFTNSVPPVKLAPLVTNTLPPDVVNDPALTESAVPPPVTLSVPPVWL